MLLLYEERFARCANNEVAELGKKVADALGQACDEEGNDRSNACSVGAISPCYAWLVIR